MKLRTTLLLLVLNVIVFFFLIRQESPFDMREQMGKDEISILPLPTTQITSIRVSGVSLGAPYELHSAEGHWRIRNPIEWDANPFAVRRMISRLESTEVNVRFPVSDIQSRNQTLADFGLENPTLEVEVSFDDESFSYAFGAPVEINDQLYMLSPAKDEILVIPSNVVQPFVIELDQLRSHSLFAIPVFEIRSLLVEFNDDNSRRRFTHRDGTWVIDSPYLLDANDERVQGAIDRLVNYEVNLDLKPGEGDETFEEVTHFNAIARFEIIGNRRNSTLLVSRYTVNLEEDPNLYLARFEGSDTTFLLPKDEIDWWRTSQTSLRERRFLDVDPTVISKVEIVKNGETSEILRLLRLENDQWRIYAGDAEATLMDYLGDGALITEALSELNDLIVLSFVNDEPTDDDLETYGLLTPETVITLEGDHTTKLLVGQQSSDGLQVYVRIEESESVYLVASEIIEGLSAAPLDYRQRTIRLVPAEAAVGGFKITDIRSGHITDATSVDSLLETAIQPMDAESAEAVFQAINVLLKDFRVAKFLEAGHEANLLQYGLVSFELPFELEVFIDNRETPSIILELSKRLSGSEQYAWIEAEGVAVKLQQEVVDMLHPLLHATEVPEEWAPAQSVDETKTEDAAQESESLPPEDTETGEGSDDPIENE